MNDVEWINEWCLVVEYYTKIPDTWENEKMINAKENQTEKYRLADFRLLAGKVIFRFQILV